MLKKNLTTHDIERQPHLTRTQIYKVYLCGLCFLLGAVFGQQGGTSCGTPPQHRAAALIIYNHITGSDLQFSLPAMQTFRSALDPRQAPPHTPNPPGGIPPLNPPMETVNILDVTNVGFAQNLRTKFYGQGNRNIDGFQFYGDVFDSLWNAGNPLAYWSQVYDLRFNHSGDNADRSSITSSGTNNDAAFFREFLRAGGALYIQTVRSESYGNRNRASGGVEWIIRNFTRDNTYSDSRDNTASGPDATNFNFHDGFNRFRCNFNDLEWERGRNPNSWAMPGGVHLTAINHGIPLITIPGRQDAVMVAWNSDGMHPDIGNGILVVGWAITAWGPQNSGGNLSRINSLTFAIIQNIFGLMSQTAMYSINKSFLQPELEHGSSGTVVIALQNNAIQQLDHLEIRDTLSRCLTFIPGSATPPVSRTETATQGRTVLVWEGLSLPPNRGNTEVRFDFNVNFNPPCN